MRDTITYAVICLLLLVTGSCDTYKTYYGTTISVPAQTDYNEVLRLEVSTSQKSLTSDEIQQLDKLRMLKLSTRTSSELELFLDHLPNPQELRVLILDSIQLKQLPASIQRFTSLQHLSLSHNKQLDLEQVINVIKELPIVFLNVQNMGLTEIPKAIESLTQLEDFNVSGNRLEEFDDYDYLASLDNLKSLWLTQNNLKRLPPSLGSLKQVRNLYIEHNQLKSIPESMLGMERLWVLHAGHNLFTELPENFGKMPALFLLHLNNNKISSIPDSYLKKRNYGFRGLILENNELSPETRDFFTKKFDHFFILAL